MFIAAFIHNNKKTEIKSNVYQQGNTFSSVVVDVYSGILCTKQNEQTHNNCNPQHNKSLKNIMLS